MNQPLNGAVSITSALSGLNVLELPGLAASFTGYILKQYGAHVTRVESPEGDAQRAMLPQIELAGTPVSASYVAYNEGKAVEFLELETENGIVEFKELIAQADVLIHEVDASSRETLAYAQTRKLNPQLIHTSISPFGTQGPYGEFSGGDLVASAMSGFMHLTGDPAGAPLRMGGNQASKLGGAEAAAGIMVALFHRDTTGEGQHVDLAVRDAMIRATVNAVPKYVYEDVVQNRVGDHWGVRAKPLKALWKCKDGWVSFVRRGGVLGGRVNAQTVSWMDEAGIDVRDLQGIEWNSMDIGNPEHRKVLDRLDEKFALFLEERSVETVFHDGLERGMTLAPVRRISEILDDEHLEVRDFWDRLEYGENSVRVPGRFIKTQDSKPRTKNLDLAVLSERTEA